MNNQNPYNRNPNAPPRGQRPPLTPEQQRARVKKQAELRKQKEAARKKQEKAVAKQQRAAAARRQKEAEARRRAAERMQRHDDKYELTEEEREIRAQMRREEKQYYARKRARTTKVLFGRFCLFLVMFVLLLCTSAGLFYANLVSYERSARRDFTYVVGSARATVPYDSMMRGGNLYVNMTPIIEMCEMAVTGDTAELRYISRDAKEHVQFIVGSTQVFINGVEERLTAAPYLDGEDLYVPYDFFSSYVSGISVLYDTEKQTVTVAQTPVPDVKDTYEKLRFVIRSDAPLTGLNEFNEFGNTPPIAFVADLSLYESYMNPDDRDAYLLLVNNAYPLPQSYVPETVEITDIRRDGRPLQYLDTVVEKAAHAMIMEIGANGFEGVNILLGYRSYGKQNSYFKSTVNEYLNTMTQEQAEATAMSTVQRAGCNPQQAGLSMVMHNIEDTSTAFAREPVYAWLEENCWKFGFIIRYPADKTAETGMAFQPYFFTYVGRYHAMRIMERGISMEEYVAELEEKDYFNGKTYAEFREALINS